jgi:hypothetical protein
MLILLDLVHCRSPVEEDPECGEVFILPFCLGQPYGWSEVCNFSYGFVSSTTFWFNPLIFHLCPDSFLFMPTWSLMKIRVGNREILRFVISILHNRFIFWNLAKICDFFCFYIFVSLELIHPDLGQAHYSCIMSPFSQVVSQAVQYAIVYSELPMCLQVSQLKKGI